MHMIKAIVAGIIGAAGALTTAAADGRITWPELGIIIGAGVVSFGGVYAAPPNTPKPPVA